MVYKIGKKPIIPDNYAVPVNHDLRGHPESPR